MLSSNSNKKKLELCVSIFIQSDTSSITFIVVILSAVGDFSAKMDNAFLLLHKWGTISKERNPITAPTYTYHLRSYWRGKT